ncbi:hypothetical protein CQA38_03175 [Campylobacter sp. MIT 12-5580]|uniref:outer membrane protein assembly factor BamE domain-containing protein n=1 Tax=unclassified Campylobacter TaxID=2593542 RepID=UPI0010F8F1DE|nr:MULTISPECIES: outer membrane protein assembly factor BamE [unclassified Campylobacter]NDJ27654.1 outer membrane protein assembly factor BamE [Campylobacter sp. MIT 19-121]TKX29787.1 hypothetical protein CQA38_03175 [Campylobacter sp. MIT 12-5580]
MIKIFFVFITSLFITACAYTQGTEISQAQLEKLQINKSTQTDVETIVGYPQRKQNLNGGEIWYYDFSKISANPFGGNVDESTIFEFDKQGRLKKKYKSSNFGNKNPLLGN